MQLLKVCKIFLLFASAATATSAPPAPSSTGSLNTTGGGGNFTAQYKLHGFRGCLKDKGHNDKEAILDALKEANTILGATGNYYMSQHWDSMNAVDFFGNPPDLKSNNLRAGLAKNMRNAYSFTNGWWVSAETTAVYCHDGALPDKNGVSYSTACGSANYPDPIVVAPDYNGKDKPALLFCNSWFSQARLGDAIKSGLSQGEEAGYDLDNYENRARAWVTAMMLIPAIGSSPQDANGNTLIGYQKYNFPDHPQHFATTPALCKYASKYFLPGGTSFVDNADSISWYAMASYVQTKLDDYPVMPFVPQPFMYSVG